MSRGLSLLALGAIANLALAGIETCPADSPLSCSSDSTDASCCYESPSGLLLQVQFWDYDPAIGPSDSWGIHGLWPDECSGNYKEDCDKSRAYKNITSLLEAAGETELLDYMQTYWQSDDESSESFWESEWAEHGTCINTIDPSCYTDYQTGDEAVDFFAKVVSLFKSLDTYSALESAGITPDEDKEYDLSDIQSATAAIHSGITPYFECDDGALSSVEYYFYISGNAINGNYTATESPSKTSCPSSVKYPPKKSSSNKNSRRSRK